MREAVVKRSLRLEHVVQMIDKGATYFSFLLLLTSLYKPNFSLVIYL